ncbi:hypothetical protein BH24CHL7_BH24CHL7_04320 [soil metagenome]
MTIRPTVMVEPIKAGVAARAIEIGIACHGRDEDRALAALRATVGIWARALASGGDLEGILARLGIVWEPGSDQLNVVPDVQHAIQ